MQINHITEHLFLVMLNSDELSALEKDSQCPVDWPIKPVDWPIKDVASLIKYVLERHVDYCQARYTK